MKRLLAAALLMLSAFSASAYDQTVAAGEACPAGTYPVTPSYEWQEGHFVLNGWVCRSLYTGR
jgi:hypothetical protein